VSNGETLWAYECNEHECSNIFLLQDLLSQRIADSLLLKLSETERQLLNKHYTNNAEAYQNYIEGRYYWNKRTADGLRKAIGYFENAVRKDPNYALAYAGLADCYALSVWYIPLPTSVALPKLKDAATKAVKIDPELAEAHVAISNMYSFEWNWDDSEREHVLAIQLNPGYATAHHWYALGVALRGRTEEGIEEARRALQIDPLSLVISTDLGWVYYLARRYDEAIEQYKRTLDLDPNFSLTHFDLALAYSAKGMHQQAISEMMKASDRGSDYLAGLGYVYGVAGRKTEALKALADLKKLSNTKYVPPYHFAWIYVGLGENDQAIDFLEKVYREHTQHVVDFKTHPMFDPLRSDPRFVNLLSRVGL